MKQHVTQYTEREYWLFQYTAGAYVQRPFERSAPGEIVPWKATRYRDRMKPGDVVFFWRAGKTAGLRGWGTVEGPPVVSKGETFERIPVKTGVNLPEVVPKAEVRKVPELKDLGVVMQGRQGTNFVLSTRQAAGLARLIAKRGIEVPAVSDAELVESARRRVKRDADQLQQRISLMGEDAPELEEVLKGSQSVVEGDVPINPDLLKATATLANKVTDEDIRATVRNLYDELSFWARTNGASEEEAPSAPEVLLGEAPAGEGAGATEEEAAGVANAATEPDPPKDSPWIWPWEERDRVGIGEPVQNLARYIVYEDLVPPRAIGLFGDWGSGKTFFMRALQSQIALLAWRSARALERNETSVFCSRVVQIHFNAWHYVESNLWASLAGHIFETLHEELVGRTSNEPVDIDELFRALATYREAADDLEQVDRQVRRLETEEIPKLEKKEEEAETGWRDQLAAFGHALSEEIKKRLSDGKTLSATQQKEIREIFQVDQVEALAESGKEMKAVIDDGRRIGTRISLLLRSWQPRDYALAAALVGLTALAVPVAIGLLHLDGVAAFSATVGGYLAAATGVVSTLAAKGRDVVKTIEQGLRLIDSARETAEKEKGPALLEAEAALEATRSAHKQAKARLERKRNELETLNERFRQQNVGVQLRTFLEDRIRDRSYERHLGLISIVRRDLEYLTDLMSRYWQQRRTGGGFIELTELEPDGNNRTTRVPFIERIVLYIDDLDRCPADKVLEVLQAVHLMLGFKLFVVVVAADVRWIGRSLVESYPHLLEGGIGTGEHTVPTRAASADDYLEKIFQIPFRIPPMDPDAQETLVDGLLAEPFLPGWDTERDYAPPVLDLNPAELSLYTSETDAIHQLHSCLGTTPRTVKRFVDIYRLMRAGMNEGDVELLGRTNQHCAILAVLALLSGSPRSGPTVVEALHRDLVRQSSNVEAGFPAWFKELVQTGIAIEEGERRSAAAVMDFLENSAPGEKGNHDVQNALLRWIPESTRYSFREVQLTRA